MFLPYFEMCHIFAISWNQNNGYSTHSTNLKFAFHLKNYWLQATDNISPYEFDLITSKRIIQEFTKPSHLRRFDLPIYLLHYHTVRKYGFFFFKFSPEIFSLFKNNFAYIKWLYFKKASKHCTIAKAQYFVKKN